MSQTYRPELREVFAQCWSDGTWLSGGICLPVRRGLVEHLNQKDPFLKFRNVALSHKKDPFPFLALRLSSVGMIVPSEHEAAAVATGAMASHPITCLMPGAMLTGTMEILQNLRVSDYLMRHSGFFPVHDCTIRVSARAQLPFPNPVELVLVNSERVTGVAEQG